MIYKDLYELHEQNDVLHVGISEVAIIEDEAADFLRSLDQGLRQRVDLLLGKIARAYEIQGFLFGGTVAGAGWNKKTRPVEGQLYGDVTCRGSTPAPVYQIDRKTNQVIAEFKSISEAARATGGDDSAIAKVCKGKIPSSGGYIWRYIEA